MQPTSPAGPMNPVAGYNPLDLVALLQSQIAQNSINAQQIYYADAVAGIEQSWRIVFRWMSVDVPSGQWGTPNWGQYGDFSTEAGTTNVQEVARFMDSSRVVPNGMYEVQLLVNGVWFSAASLLQGFPMTPVPAGTTQPILYQPGPAVAMFSPAVPAQQAPAAFAVPAPNTSNPVGTPVAGFPNGFHNLGGAAFASPGMPDPTGQYTLRTPSLMQTNPAAMIWVKTGQ